jgi:hypothetical protein
MPAIKALLSRYEAASGSCFTAALLLLYCCFSAHILVHSKTANVRRSEAALRRVWGWRHAERFVMPSIVKKAL